MTEMSIKEAAQYGLRLTEEQRDFMEGEGKYALAAQVMPTPHCCETLDRVAIGICTPDHMDRKRVILPTVIERATPEDAEEASRWHNRWRPKLAPWDEPIELPTLCAWAVDLPILSTGGDCGCALTGDIACGCGYHEAELQLISPYSIVPVSDDVALEVLKTAYQELPASNFYPLLELVELQNHGMDFVVDADMFEVPDDIEWGSDIYWEIVGAAEKRLLTAIGHNPNKQDHLHLDRRDYSYEIPAELKASTEELMLATKRALFHTKSLLKRDPRALEVESKKVFAFPCNR